MRREEIVEESDSTENPSINGRYHRFNVKLGKGAFKEVYKAFDTHEQIDVAWNSIDLSLINTEDEKQKIFKECTMLRRLNHPHILKITNQWFNNKTDKLCFITNIVHDGSLAKFFRKRQVNLLRVKQISKQILQALEYLHEHGVIHRDLKCDNIFIEGNTGKVVLGDLGLSCNVVSARSIVGTPHWMAPELYREDYNEMVDIWSFGMCVLELITSLIPYSECKGAFQVYQNITAGNKPQSLTKINSPYVRAFINICLNVDYTQRPSAAELLNHPFLYQRTFDTTLCSELMKVINTEPKQSKQEKKEEDALKQSMLKPPVKKKKVKSKHKHTFNKEPATSPPPPSASNLQTIKVPKSKRDAVSVKKVKNNGDNIKIKLQIVCSKFPKPMNVEFDFSHKQEKPSSVAMEMTRDLELPNNFTDKVEKAIKNAITKARKLNKANDTQKIHKPPPPKSKMQKSKSIDNNKSIGAKILQPPTLETRSRKSGNFMKDNTALQLQSSGTSLTASIPSHTQSPVENSIKKLKPDPMYSKPVNRMFEFNSQQPTDYLTESPPQTVVNNNGNIGQYMPMIRNQSSPDPPLQMMNGHGHVNDNNTRESLSNPLDDISSIGSIPQPNTNSINGIDIRNVQPNQLTSSQSLPQHSIYDNNIAMDVTNANTMYNASLWYQNHKQSPTAYHTQLPSHSYANAMPSYGSSSVPNSVPQQVTNNRQRGQSTQSANGINVNVNMNSIMARSISQQSTTSTSHTQSCNNTPKLPPVPEPKIMHTGAMLDNKIMHSHKVAVNNNTNVNLYKSISPPKSTTPPTPPPVIGIQDHNNNINNGNDPVLSSQPIFQYTNPKSQSSSPAPQNHIQLVHSLSDHSMKNNNEKNKVKFEPVPVLSDGLVALESLNSKSSDIEIYKVTVKLTLEELIQEFVKRNKSYNQLEGKNGLARKLVNILKEEVKHLKKERDSPRNNTSPTASSFNNNINLELPNKKEQTPDSVFSAKSTSVESAISMETAEKLSKKRDSGRENVLKLRDCDSGGSSDKYTNIYDNYTNKGDQHNRTGTAVIHPSFSALPNVLPRQLSHDKSNKMNGVSKSHNLTPSGGYINGYINGYNTNGHGGHGHMSNYSSASNVSTMSGMTMGTMHTMASSALTNSSALSMGGYEEQKEDDIGVGLPLISTLKLPFIVEELKLPSPNNDIIFDTDVLNQISTKQLELHNEYIDFVKRKYELLQLRYATLEAEYKDNNIQQNETKLQEELSMKDKINKKRIELTEKFAEWLSDREQIAQLKSRIEKKRSTSNDKLPAFHVQLEFENDPQFVAIMKSQLNDSDKRQCKMKIQDYRKKMMDEYRIFYLETLQVYKDKEMKQQQM